MKKNIMKSEKQKEIKLPMEFNPGLQKYEPKLSLKRSKKDINKDFNWILFILILLGIFALGILAYYFLI
jgi:hypothetical protein